MPIPQKWAQLRPSNSLVLFTDRMVTNCPIIFDGTADEIVCD